MSSNKQDARQSRLVPVQTMIGSASGATLDTIFPKINDELKKLFEDRNVLLTDGGIITWTGTQIQFTENLKLQFNQTAAAENYGLAWVFGIDGWVFTLSSPGNATAGAVYSNNGNNYTVNNTITGGTTLNTGGVALSQTSGVLIKVSGTGDATLNFSSVVPPYYTITITPSVGLPFTFTWLATSQDPYASNVIVTAFNNDPQNIARGYRMYYYITEAGEALTGLSGNHFHIVGPPGESYTVSLTGSALVDITGPYYGSRYRPASAFTVISLGSANVNLNNNDMWYAVVNRIAGTATLAVAQTLPELNSANQEVFLIAKRVDAGDGTQRLYWRNGMALNAGQTVRLGASGSGGGAGQRLEDLNSLLFRASFEDVFDESPTSALSGVDATVGKTDATIFSAAKGMYTLNYDASKTIAAGTTTTNIDISAAASFTVKVGDVVVNASQARRITAVASQSSFTTEAFSVAPTLTSQVTVSQAVYSKDIYNLPVDGNAISAAFPASTFQEILTDYEDTTAANDNIFDVDVAPVIGYTASQDGVTFTNKQIRPTLETDTISSVMLPAPGSALYFRFFAHKSSGSGIVNLLRYKTFVQKTTNFGPVAGGVLNAAYAFTDGVGTPVNATVSLLGGKTTITLTNGFQYPVGANAGLPVGALDVYLDGKLIPRFIDAILTPDASYTELNSTMLQLDADYSGVNLAVEIVSRLQIIDSSSQNITNINILQNKFSSIYSAIVGSAVQVTGNIATHSSLQAAITAFPTGRILVLPGYTTSEAITVSSTGLTIEGGGYNTQIPGTFTLNASAQFCTIKNLRFNGNLTLASGSSGNFIREAFVAPTATVSDLGTANSKLIISG